MDYKVKSYVMLSIIFVLGFLAGMLVKDLVTRSPFEQIRNMRVIGGFAKRMENVLELNQQQKENIEPILRRYDEKFHKLAESRMNEVTILADSLKAELKPYLSEEQIQRLRDEFMPPGPGMGGKPPF